MGRIGTKMPNFGLTKIRPLVRVRSAPNNAIIATKPETDDEQEKTTKDSFGKKSGQKIMAVVDSSMEAKNAVQWALSHAVRSHDTVILLNVIKPRGQGSEELIQKDTFYRRRVPEFLTCIKNMCHLNMPEVNVEIVMVEGKEKGPTILKEATREGVAMLILGQKKRWLAWRDMSSWAMVAGDEVAEYCVQNASCMAIAVRRKSKKLGGYIITTKSHKDFWLLA